MYTLAPYHGRPNTRALQTTNRDTQHYNSMNRSKSESCNRSLRNIDCDHLDEFETSQPKVCAHGIAPVKPISVQMRHKKRLVDSQPKMTPLRVS